MDLIQRIRHDLEQAIKQGDKVRRSVLRLILSSIRNAEIARQRSLDEGDVLDVIAREIKQRHQSIEAFKQGNRQDLIAQEEAELAILLEYLPQQMSRDEIIAAGRKVIDELGATGQSDKGKVMSRIMPQLKGKASGQEVSAIISELLNDV